MASRGPTTGFARRRDSDGDGMVSVPAAPNAPGWGTMTGHRWPLLLAALIGLLHCVQGECREPQTSGGSTIGRWRIASSPFDGQPGVINIQFQLNVKPHNLSPVLMGNAPASCHTCVSCASLHVGLSAS